MSTYSKKSIRKKFFSFVIPSVISMWVFTIYTMVDGMFVARGVGEKALAAVNISMPLINITFGLGILFAVGASTKASIFKGKGKMAEANQVFTTSTLSVFILASVLSLWAYLNLEKLARLLGSSLETHTYVLDYLSIIIPFIPFYMTSYNFEVLIKADGFPKKAVGTMILGAVTNIVLDYLFVIRYSWGIQGAALATGLSQLLAFSIFLAHFLSKKSTFSFVKISWHVKDLISLAKIGLADSLTEFSIASIIFMFNQVVLLFLGNDGLVIFTVIAYVSQLVLMSMIGINQGMQPLVSYSYGKKDKHTYQYIFKLALVCASFASIFAFAVAVFFPSVFMSLFIDPLQSPLLYQEGLKAFRLFSSSYLPLGMVIVIYGYLTAIEKNKAAITISVFRGWIFVALALLVMTKIFGDKGIWLAMLVSESMSLGLAVYLYRKTLLIKSLDSIDLMPAQ